MESNHPHNTDRLDSWKSIAQYLSRSVRTVQRWHSEYGLPIRHLAGDRSSAFAFPEELDEWMRGRSLGPGEKPLDFSPPGERSAGGLEGSRDEMARLIRPPATRDSVPSWCSIVH